MKQRLKKWITMMMVIIIGIGIFPMMPAADYTMPYNAFHNKFSVDDCGVDFVTMNKGLYNLYNNKNQTTAYLLHANTIIYFCAPPGDGTVVSVKSSNPKVVTVVDQQKGMLKTKSGSGKAWISYKVEYKLSSKEEWEQKKWLNTCSEPGFVIKVSKKGKIATLEAKALIYLLCKGGKHKFKKGKIIQKPTCAEEGTKVYTCKKCHYEKSVSIKATGKHQYSAWKEDPATCEYDGYKYRECKTCGKSQQVKIGTATGHNYDAVTHKCLNCGEEDPAYEDYDDEE